MEKELVSLWAQNADVVPHRADIPKRLSKRDPSGDTDADQLSKPNEK
jgi:hypothetical protein